jgi:hypothetical protein
MKSAIRHDGVPTISQFAGDPGPAIVIDTNTGTQYWLAAGDVVTAVQADPWVYALLGAAYVRALLSIGGTGGTVTLQHRSATGGTDSTLKQDLFYLKQRTIN